MNFCLEMLQLVEKKASGSGSVCALQQLSEREGKPDNCLVIVTASLVVSKRI